MRFRANVTMLEDGGGVTRCPHCGQSLSARSVESEYKLNFSPEEARECAGQIFRRFYRRETMLALLAGLLPALRRDIADVYPIQPGEPLGDELTD
jgi:hypothetical protein